MDDLIGSRAVDIVEALRREQVGPHDLLDALEGRIEKVEGAVNALPTLCFERARQAADRLLRLPLEQRGLLRGLPIPIKDLTHVQGVRTTFGSPVFSAQISDHSDISVQRLEREGGIVFAKSNTPEFGAGANTFNEVLGATRNPWNLALSAAGSSGGAAAALASGTAWVAQGSDNAGSLRSPASFCGVVGLRPSPGRVARGPSVNPYQTLAVDGPMARNVEDLCLLLDAMCGEDPRDPLSLPAPAEPFLQVARRRRKPTKVAFSADLGITPIDPEIARLCRQAAYRFEEMGVAVDEATPDFSGAHESYQALRALGYAASHAELLAVHRERLKPEVVDNIERGLRLTGDDIGKALRMRGAIRRRLVSFFEDYDLLLTPATIVPPYPVEQRYVGACGEVTFQGYIDWLAIAYVVSLVSLPALSMPCAYTARGLPVGLQVIGPPRGEAALLAGALLLEEQLGLDLVPIMPRGATELESDASRKGWR